MPRIFGVQGAHWWSKSHAQVPVVLALNKQVWRVYYATRDAGNTSRISFFDVEAGVPEKILYQHDVPILQPGPLGSFDDSGVMPTCVFHHQGKVYLYYIGWSVRASVPYHNSVGLAISDDGLSFSRVVPGPVIGPGPYDPYFCGTAYVLPIQKPWRAYYLSCIGWKMYDGKPEAAYDLKLAYSSDGVFWKQEGQVAIPVDAEEEALASATVVPTDKGYRMWYSSRRQTDFRNSPSRGYQIRTAVSVDGINWEKLGSVGGAVGLEDWDSTMQAYPYAMLHKGKVFLFYNGNGFGKTGIGYFAVERW